MYGSSGGSGGGILKKLRGLTPSPRAKEHLFCMSIMNDSCLTLMVPVVCITSQMWRQGIECIGLLILAPCTPATGTVPHPPLPGPWLGVGVGGSDTPPRWLKVQTVHLKHYIFLKMQAYRMQEKCSPEAHNCKIPTGECAPGPPPPS